MSRFDLHSFDYEELRQPLELHETSNAFVHSLSFKGTPLLPPIRMSFRVASFYKKMKKKVSN